MRQTSLALIAVSLVLVGCKSAAPGGWDDAAVVGLPEAGVDSGIDGGLDAAIDAGPGPHTTLGHLCATNQDCDSRRCEVVYTIGTTPISLCVIRCTQAMPTCPPGASCYVPSASSAVCLPDCTASDPRCVDALHLTCRMLQVNARRCVGHPCGPNACCANGLPCVAGTDCCTGFCDPVDFTCQTP